MKVSVSNFTKTLSVRAVLIHSDGQRDRKMAGRTDMTNLIGAL